MQLPSRKLCYHQLSLMLIMPIDSDLQLRLVLMHLTNCHLLEREQHLHMQRQQLHE